MDISDTLNSIPVPTSTGGIFNGDWTNDRLASWLDKAGLNYTPRDSDKPSHDGGKIYALTECPFCRHSEGNPAVWLTDGTPRFKCFRAKHCADKSWRDLDRQITRPRLKRISAFEFARQNSTPRPAVIEGLIRKGDVVNIIGGPKARKSFLMALLAICVASGIQFLAWPTRKGKVLLVDNELQGDDLARRLQAITDALGLDWGTVAPNIDIIKLRGVLADVYTIRDDLRENPGQYDLIIVDAIYKVMPVGSNENSNSDVTRAYVVLDSIAEENETALTAVHHTSRGNQAQKSVTDMGAGAGAQSRSADAHIVLRDHEDEGTVIVEGVLRALPPFEPICIKFDWPLWRVADADPHKVMVGPHRKASLSLNDFVAAVPFEPTPLADFRTTIKAQSGIARSTLELLFVEAKKRNLVIVETMKAPGAPKTIRRVSAEKGKAA